MLSIVYKCIVLLSVIISINSCNRKIDKQAIIKVKSSNLDAKINFDNTSKKGTIIKHSELIDLDSVLIEDDNNYFLELTDGNLSFCLDFVGKEMLSNINVKNISTQIEEYLIENDKVIYTVLHQKESFVKIFVDDIDSTIICGKIVNEDFLVKGPIKLKMNKNVFLGLFFKQSDLFSKISNIKIFDDPMGEKMIEFIFINDRLNKIIFSSSNGLIKTSFP